jgi:hypothetical protein
MTTSGRGQVDRLNAALIELLAAEPRVGVLEPPGASVSPAAP